MTVDSIELLKQVFPGMSSTALVEMAWLTRTRTYPPATILCHEGAVEEVFYIIGEGQVVITQQLGDEERLLRHAGPGQYFGEMALIANTPRNATVETIEETTVLEIDKPTLTEMIRRNPVIALTMFHTSVSWLRANDAAAIEALTRQKWEIERAYQELQVQEQRRSEFLTMLAHELRTPLTSANGFMQLIRSGSMTGLALTMALDKVAYGLDRVVSLVNDLLFIQEMDLLEPTVRAVNLPEIVAAVVLEASAYAQENGITIVTHLPPALPVIQADDDGLMRAFRALLDNAIKFSPDGGEVRIEVDVTTDHVAIAITDPGIGIEPEFIPHIFERFARREQYGDTLFGGMGLGLSIAKHLIESIGGRITVQSELNQGSTFTVYLPVINTKAPAEANAPTETGASYPPGDASSLAG